MAATLEKKAPSAPMALTQDQVEQARKGYSERVFSEMARPGRPKKAAPKARSRKRR